MKLIRTLAIGLLCGGLLGCGAKPLSDAFDKEEVILENREVITEISEGSYEALFERFNDSMKEALPADQMEAQFGPVLEEFGPLVEIGEPDLTGGTTEEIGEYALAVTKCKYEKATVTYTVTYDTYGHVCGIYLK